MPTIRGAAKIDYVNHKGKRAIRTILPIKIFRGISEFHPGKQYFLKAWDFDRKEERDFAMRDIKQWLT